MAVIYPGHGVGLRNVGSYQVSGEPWLTGSTIGAEAQFQVDFPYVTKAFTVQVTGDKAVNVQFDTAANDSVTGHEFDVYPMSSSVNGIHGNMSQRFEVKCKSVYIANTSDAATTAFKIFAELTGIPTASMYALTGSGINAYEQMG